VTLPVILSSFHRSLSSANAQGFPGLAQVACFRSSVWVQNDVTFSIMPMSGVLRRDCEAEFFRLARKNRESPPGKPVASQTERPVSPRKAAKKHVWIATTLC